MPRKNSDPIKPGYPVVIPVVLQSALFVVVAVSAFTPTSHLWGIDHIRYFPPAVRIAALFVVLLTFVPAITERIYNGSRRAVARLIAGTRGAGLLMAGLAVVLFVLFVGFPAATSLLGDGELQSDLWGDAVRQGMSYPTFLGVVLGDVQQRFAFGTNAVGYAVARLGAAAGAENPVDAVLLLFAVLGVAMVLTVLNFFRRRGLTPRVALAAVAAVVFSGAMQLFFGYVEVYAPLVVVTAFYTMAASDTLRTGRRLWLPLLLLALGVFLHAQALLLVPSAVALTLGYLYYRRDTRRMRRLGIAVILVSVAGAIVLGFLPATSRFFLPYTTTESAYGVISFRHVADVVNVVLLIFPMGVLVLGIFLDRRIATAGGTGAPAAGETWKNAFHGALATAGILFLLLFHPDLGMANDWDLYIVPVVCLAVPAFRYLGERLGRIDRRAAARMVVPAAALSAMITVSWVAVNAGEERAVGRYQEIIAGDRMSGAYGLEILASYYKDKGDVQAEIRTLEKIVSVSANPRYRFVLGLRYYHVGDKEKAIDTLYRCLATRPGYDEAREYLVQMLYFTKRYDEVITVATEGARLHADSGFYPFYAGKAHLAAGRVDDARAAFDRCSRLQMTPEMKNELDKILETLGNRP